MTYHLITIHTVYETHIHIPKQKKEDEKIFVACTYKSGTYLPDIEFNTDSREDADKYAEIKKRSDEERDYIVLTLD